MYARGVSRDINPAARHTSASWEGVVSLASVLTQVRPAYGGTSWDEALAYLDSEPAESAVVAALCASLLESGAELFESPIRVFRADPDDRPEDGVADFTPNSDGGGVGTRERDASSGCCRADGVDDDPVHDGGTRHC